MIYDHRKLEMPVHPGDIIYVVDEGRGWTVRPDIVNFVCVAQEDILILRKDIDLEKSNLEDEWFLTEAEAKRWADAHRPDPPYRYGYDAKRWMHVNTWIPGSSGWCYVRTSDKYVCMAFYDDGTGEYGSHRKTRGFYESDDPSAVMIAGVESWIDHYWGLTYALQAGEYDR